MTILLEQFQLPSIGTVKLDLHRVFEIKVTAEQAQRKVHLWLFTEVGNMLCADTPTLAIGEDIVWRVPVVLTALSMGKVGVVGNIDVDVQNGVIDDSPENIETIQSHCIELGKRFPAYEPRKTVEKYHAQTLTPTRSKAFGNEEIIQRISTALTSL